MATLTKEQSDILLELLDKMFPPQKEMPDWVIEMAKKKRG